MLGVFGTVVLCTIAFGTVTSYSVAIGTVPVCTFAYLGMFVLDEDEAGMEGRSVVGDGRFCVHRW